MEDFRLDFKKMKNFTEKRRMRKRDTPGRVSIPIHYQKTTLLLCTLEDRYADAVGALSPVFFYTTSSFLGIWRFLGWELSKVENELSSVPWSSIRVPKGVLERVWKSLNIEIQSWGAALGLEDCTPESSVNQLPSPSSRLQRKKVIGRPQGPPSEILLLISI